MEIIVSVIIPVYNVEKYVGDCLKSVQNQTLKEIEILCINDAGTDGGWEIVKRAAEEDGRIRLFENGVNTGLSAVRNRGLSQAKGKFVYFLDSDDGIRPEALEKLAETAEKDGLDAVTFSSELLFETEEFREKFGTNPAVYRGDYPDVYCGKDLMIRWMENNDWIPLQQRFFYRRGFLEGNGLRFMEGILHEDEIFTFDVLMRARRIRVLKDPWFLRRYRADSIMTRKTGMKNVEGCVRILQHLSETKDGWAETPALAAAVTAYRDKIAEDVRKKYASAAGDGCFAVSQNGPELSVLIPVYNVAPYLEECLESVLSQDFIDLEVLCVDDASTDGSDRILRAYAKADPRIRLFRQDRNRGQAAARNLALREARGEYVYMLDADDWILPGTLSMLMNIAEEEQTDVIGFENRQFADDPAFEEAAAQTLFTYRDAEGLYEGTGAFIRVVTGDVLSPSVPTYLIRRAFLEEKDLRFTEGIFHEDIGFIFEMLLLADSVRLLHKEGFCRRFRAHSTVTGGFSPAHAEGYLKSWQKGVTLRPSIQEKMQNDPRLAAAVRKWRRDVLGRIRTLYLGAEEQLYGKAGGNVDEETGLLFTMLQETTTGRARSRMILGEETVRKLEEEKEVYLCGAGQYACRMAEVIGALDVRIRGFLMSPEEQKGRKNCHGFPVFSPEEAENKKTTVILAVSHYNEKRKKDILVKAGFETIVKVRF